MLSLRLLFGIVVVALTVLSTEARAVQSERTARPNILFIMTDDHASHAIGAYGSRINETPHLDRLAGQGRLFRNCFVTNSICGPSRATILTGKLSHRNGVPDNRSTFDGAQTTFPKLLQKSGYQTAMIGKWHLRSDPTGFDAWEVLIGQGPYYNPRLKSPDGTVQHTGYTTDIITERALSWLKSGRDGERPFALCLQHKAPHREWAPGPPHLTTYDDVTIPEPDTLFDDWTGRASPAAKQEMTIAEHLSDRDLKLVPPRNLTPQQLEAWNAAYGPKNQAFREARLQGRELVKWKYQRYIKDYLRCIASVDDSIGRVLAYLDESGLAENTVVIYTSDQGFYLGDHGWYDKRWMYEESLRTPLIVRWPGVTPPGSEDDHLVQNLDFAQTILDIAGVEAPEDMQGRSLVPLLEGKDPEDWRDAVYYHYYEFPAVHSVRRHYGVRTERYKLIHYYRENEWELFDLEKDPDELMSVYADPAYAEIRAALAGRIDELQERYGDTDPEGSLREGRQDRLRQRAAKVEPIEVLHLAEPKGELPSLDPSAKPWTIGVWCRPTELRDGVLLAQGGEVFGYSLFVTKGKPGVAVRSDSQVWEVFAQDEVPAEQALHVAARLKADGTLELFVNGKKRGEVEAGIIAEQPAEGLSLGQDSGTAVGSYVSPAGFAGDLAEIRLHWGSLPDETIANWAKKRPEGWSEQSRK